MEHLDVNRTSAFLAAVSGCRENVPLAPLTSLKIGGSARLFFEASTADDLVHAIDIAERERIPWVMFGGGTNTLVSDDGYEGVVLRLTDRTIRIQGNDVVAAAGAFTTAVARQLADAGLSGCEWAATIPGMIGGAVAGNAGCYGGEMKDVVESVDIYDPTSQQRRTLVASDCGFGYRESNFHHEPWVILSVTLRLKPDDAVACKQRIEAYVAKRAASQPQGAWTAGCLFKNTKVRNDADLDGLRRASIEIPNRIISSGYIPSGWVIEQLGLKGERVGKAQVSPIHANFVVNTGGASAKDVLALSSLIKMRARDEFGVLMEDEARLIGF